MADEGSESMARPTFGSPEDDPARKREDASDRSAGRVENLDELAEALGLASLKPVPAAVEAPPGDTDLTAGGRRE
jgi:hypothetical protein